MSAVYKREMNAYMNNVYGYLFISVLLLFVGIMVFIQNLGYAYPNVEYALLNGEYVLLFMVPVLCMRSMAEDRRNKTDMFYLSLPLKTSSVVLGKYLALLTVYAIPCALICLYPVVLNFFGDVNYLSAYVGILFFFLLGAALLAVCQFLSSLTDNLVVAAVLGVGVSVLLYFLPIIGYILPTASLASFIGFLVVAALAVGVAFLVTRNLVVTAMTGVVLIVPLSVLYIFLREKFVGLFPAVLEFVSPFLHFEYTAQYGLFSVPSLVLLVSYCVFFVFLTVQSADKKRWG